MTNITIDDAIVQAQTALQHADAVIAISQKKLEDMEEKRRMMEEENEREQAAIDEEIVFHVQDMDEKTVEFIKDTEV